MNKIYWKIGICFLAIFIAGSTVGSLVTLHIVKKKARQWLHSETFATQALAKLDSKLHLNPEQRKQVEQTLRAEQPAWQHLNLKQIYERRMLLDDIQEQISLYLNDEQKKTLEDMREERIKRFRTLFDLPDVEDVGHQ